MNGCYQKKNVAFGKNEPNSSEPTQELRDWVFQMRIEGCVCEEEEDGWREGGRKWLICILVLCVCFLVSVLIVKAGMRCMLLVCSIESGCVLHI